MSRSGYVEDFDSDVEDVLSFGRWRAQVASSIRGKRGQSFLKELACAMDAMPVKELIKNDLVDSNGCCCTLGVVCKSRGINVSDIDTEDHEQLAEAIGIARQLVQEIEYLNDECDDDWRMVGGKYQRVEVSAADRWRRMRQWVEKMIVRA